MPHGPGHCLGYVNADYNAAPQCRVCWLEHHKPGPVRKVINFAKSVTRHVTAGRPQATAEQQAERMALCLACPEYDNGKCGKCGCGLKLKTAWLLETCPLGAW